MAVVHMAGICVKKFTLCLNAAVYHCGVCFVACFLKTVCVCERVQSKESEY